jgi:hypothetical protein
VTFTGLEGKTTRLPSIVESCRRLNIPIRQYLADILPGLAEHLIQSMAELTLPPTLRKSSGSLSPAARIRQPWGCRMEAINLLSRENRLRREKLLKYMNNNNLLGDVEKEEN